MSEYKIVRGVEYMSNGCDCCEPTEFDTYEVWVDGHLNSTHGYMDDALSHIITLAGLNFEYVEGQEDE